MEKIVTIGDKQYTLRPYGIEAWRKIGKAAWKGKELDTIEYALVNVFYSISAWNLKDGDKDLPVTWENFERFVPPAHVQEMVLIAEAVNGLTEEEKNVLPGQSAIA